VQHFAQQVVRQRHARVLEYPACAGAIRLIGSTGSSMTQNQWDGLSNALAYIETSTDSPPATSRPLPSCAPVFARSRRPATRLMRPHFDRIGFADRSLGARDAFDPNAARAAVVDQLTVFDEPK
jgi:hypothetical protein